jgi:hypothetical protein
LQGQRAWPKLLVTLGLGSSLVFACSLSGSNIDSATPALDDCRSDRDCPADVRCLSQVCVDPRPPALPLVFEMIPAAGTQSIAGVAFTELVDYGAAEPPKASFTLGFVSRIESSFAFDPIESERCVPRSPEASPADPADTGPLVRITMAPRKRLLGFADASRVVENAAGASSMAWNVAPGVYDVYVEPLRYDGACARPPLFISSQVVPAGDVTLPILLGDPEVLQVRVRFPGAVDRLTGFSLTLVEGSSGRPISSQGALVSPIESDSGLEYVVSLAVGPGDLETRGTSLLRLAPSPGVVAPTVYVPLAVAQLLETEGAVVDQLTQIPGTVRFSGRVVRQGSLTGKASVVTFRAETLDSLAPGTLASLTRIVETDENGGFEVDLPPGSYQAHVEVDDPELARATARFVVSPSAEPQVGKTIEVTPRREVSGRLWSPRGNVVSGAIVELITEPSEALRGQGYGAWLGRGQSSAAALTSTSGDDGRFSVHSDAGVFNVVARPTVSGLPWLLRRSVLVGDGDVILGDVRAEAPVRIRGTVVSDDLGRATPFVLVRVYAFVKGGLFTHIADDAEFVLPIGEARADENGRFDLYLPADVAVAGGE